MKAIFTISEQDYVDAMRLFIKPTVRLTIAYAIFAIGLAALAVFGAPMLRGAAISGLIGGLSFTLIVQFFISPILARKHYRDYKSMHGEFGIEINDDGVQFISSSGSGKLVWDEICKWRQNDQFVLIYPMPRLFHIVPKSVDSQGLNVQELTESLLQQVGKPT